jgi:hypothetical protein
MLILQGMSFTDCCVADDYRVTLGGKPCNIDTVYTNLITCVPPKTPWNRDSSANPMASDVIVSFTTYMCSLLFRSSDSSACLFAGNCWPTTRKLFSKSIRGVVSDILSQTIALIGSNKAEKKYRR